MNELYNDCFYPLTVKELQHDMIVQEGDILMPVIWTTLCVSWHLTIFWVGPVQITL